MGKIMPFRSDKSRKAFWAKHRGQVITPQHDRYYQQQLERGTKVEMEHTTDPKIARQIAKDHLAESPDYYVELTKMERKLKKPKVYKATPKSKSGNIIPRYMGEQKAKAYREKTGKPIMEVG